MKSVYPALTPDQFDDALAAGLPTDDLGARRDDEFGNGLINAQKGKCGGCARERCGHAGRSGARRVPASINFGAFDNTFDVELRNAGGSSVSIVAASSNQPWLQATPFDIDANGLGTYRLAVDRTQVASDGTYTGLISVTSTANPIDCTGALINDTAILERTLDVVCNNDETDAVEQVRRVVASEGCNRTSDQSKVAECAADLRRQRLRPRRGVDRDPGV
jgi:hypothetical protein